MSWYALARPSRPADFFTGIGFLGRGLAVYARNPGLVLLGMLPALMERDLDTFGEALHDFNARAGEVFAPVQGGTYAGRRVEEIVTFFRRRGVRGVGQSSWGPAVFAILGDEERAADLAQRLRHDGIRVFVTRACNHGAEAAVTT